MRPSNRQYKWWVVLMLWTICVFNYADRQAIFSVFPLLEREMQLTPVELGLLGSAFAWVYGLMAPLAGMVVDRVRRKTAILGGLHVWSIICMATALSTNFRHLFFFRAAEGLGETFYFPASMSLFSDYHGRATRSRAMGLHQTSVYVGTIGGGFFAGLIGQHYGWRLSFIVCGSLGSIIAQRESLGLAIALASIVYLAAGALLLVAILFFVKRDVAKMEREMSMSGRLVNGNPSRWPQSSRRSRRTYWLQVVSRASWSSRSSWWVVNRVGEAACGL